MPNEWIALIKSMPGAAKAVAEMVGEIGHLGASTLSIGTAKANQIAQGIKDETAARSNLTSALTKAAEAYIANHPDEAGEWALQQRALGHGVQKMIQQQASREAVTVLALEQLRDDPPSEPPQDVPADDWLNLFSSFAERATSETMRQHWANILSGEIRKPGSFSMATLQLAAILDHTLASIIQEICGWIVDGSYVPAFGPLYSNPLYSKMLTLDGIGFLRINTGERFYDFPVGGFNVVDLKDASLMFKTEGYKRVTIKATFLTPQGRELLQIISYETNPAVIGLITTEFKRQGVGEVHVVRKGQSSG